MQRVFHPDLALLQFGFGGGTYLDERHTSAQASRTLVEFFPVVIALGGFTFLVDDGNPVLNRAGVARAVDQCGAVLAHLGAFGTTQICQGQLAQAQAHGVADHLATGQNRHILQHGLTLRTEPGGLDGAGLDGAPDVVDDQSGQRVAVQVFGNHQQGLTGLDHLFEQGQQIFQRRQPAFAQQDAHIVQHRAQAFGVVDEVRRQVAIAKLQALHHVEHTHQARAVFDRDGPFAAHLVDGAGHQFTNRSVVVGRDGGHMRNVLRVGAGLGHALEFGHHGFNRSLDAALEVHRVHATRQIAQAFVHHAVRQHGGGGGAVTGHLAGAHGHLAQQLRPHVFKRVFQVNGLGHQHARVHDLGRAPFALQNHGAPARPHRHLDGFGQSIDAPANFVAGFVVKHQVFGFHRLTFPCGEWLG